MKLQPEEREAQVFVRQFTIQLRDHRHALFHVANERKVSPGRNGMVTHAILESSGFRDGVSDYMLAVAAGGYHGLFLELKAGAGALRKPQRAFLDDMRRQGYGCAVAWDAEAALAACWQYLGGTDLSHKWRVVRGFPIAGRQVRLNRSDWLTVPSHNLDEITLTGTVRRKAKP